MILTKINGGNRFGPGRKAGTCKFAEGTTVVSLPAGQLAVVKDFLAAYQRKKLATDLSANLDAVGNLSLAILAIKPIKLPLFISKVPAGFPSPTEEHVEKRLDLSEFLIDQIDAPFFVTI